MAIDPSKLINVGTTANDGTGDPLRTAFQKANTLFTELWDDDEGDVNSVNAGTGISVDQTTGAVTVTNASPNATHTGEVTGATALTIAENVITYAKLGSEFTTSTTISTNVDFSLAQVFLKTLTGNTTLTFSNANTGMVKDLVISGDYTLTLPAGSTVAGTYNGTVSNLIQVVVTAPGVYWFSISQAQ